MFLVTAECSKCRLTMKQASCLRCQRIHLFTCIQPPCVEKVFSPMPLHIASRLTVRKDANKLRMSSADVADVLIAGGAGVSVANHRRLSALAAAEPPEPIVFLHKYAVWAFRPAEDPVPPELLHDFDCFLVNPVGLRKLLVSGNGAFGMRGCHRQSRRAGYTAAESCSYIGGALELAEKNKIY